MRMLSRAECRRRYEVVLAEFALPGRRDYAVTHGGLANWGRASGLSAEEVVADAHALGVLDRDGSIRSAWNSSTMRADDGTAATFRTSRRATKPKPQPLRAKARFSVRALVGDTSAADGGREDWLLDLSPVPVRDLTPSEQAAAFLNLFEQEQYLYGFANLKAADGTAYATPGRLGQSVRRCREWLAAVERGDALGVDRIVPNALTGRLGRNKSGKPSMISADCLAGYDWLIIEFDELPIAWQYAFWRAFLSVPHPLASVLAAIVFSGRKSLHGLLHVGCSSRAEWEAVRNRIAALFDADPPDNAPPEVLRFCADGQAMRPRQGVRLAGVGRCDERGRHTGAVQRLLYLNPAAAEPTATQLPAAPEAPPPPATATEPQTATAYTCDTCGCAARCREAWGRYWTEKSHGGQGCNAPVLP